MTLIELLKIANKGYPDGDLAVHFNAETGAVEPVDGAGDTLALFLVRELVDTFEPDATDQQQLDTAADVIDDAIGDLNDVREALEDAAAGDDEGKDDDAEDDQEEARS